MQLTCVCELEEEALSAEGDVMNGDKQEVCPEAEDRGEEYGDEKAEEPRTHGYNLRKRNNAGRCM